MRKQKKKKEDESLHFNSPFSCHSFTHSTTFGDVLFPTRLRLLLIPFLKRRDVSGVFIP